MLTVRTAERAWGWALVLLMGAVRSSQSRVEGGRESWEDEHGRGVVEPERPVEYLEVDVGFWGGGRQRSTDGLGSFFLGAMSRFGWVGSKKGTRE